MQRDPSTNLDMHLHHTCHIIITLLDLTWSHTLSVIDPHDTVAFQRFHLTPEAILCSTALRTNIAREMHVTSMSWIGRG